MRIFRTIAAMLSVFASLAGAAEPADTARQAQPEQAQAGEERTARPAEPGPAVAADPNAAASQRGRRVDRLDLDTTVVTGNRELPKVLYIVPWKKADLGDLPGQPFNTLLDEALAPVDRDVFRREVTYYGAISGDSDGAQRPSSEPAEATGGSEK